LLEVILGRQFGVWCALQQEKLAFDTQQFSHGPVFLGTLGSHDGFVNYRESLGDLPRARQAFRQRAKKYGAI
jgi:hypothetical protein